MELRARQRAISIDGETTFDQVIIPSPSGHGCELWDWMQQYRRLSFEHMDGSKTEYELIREER